MISVDPIEARDRARNIIDGFRPKDPPRPFRGFLDAVGSALRWIGRLLATPFRWSFEHLGEPAGTLVFVILVGGTIAAIVFAISKIRIGRLSRGRSDTAAQQAISNESPESLEAGAAAAADRGDFATAVRLRFRAGLQRLDRDARAITYHDSIGTAEVRRSVGQSTFDALANTFDRVTYGDGDAEPNDDDTARRDWPVVVKTAHRR